MIFTSANGVRYFIERLDAGEGDLRDWQAKICAIGPATADALGSLHLKVDLMPEQYVAESVLAAFAPRTSTVREYCCRAPRWRGT